MAILGELEGRGVGGDGGEGSSGLFCGTIRTPSSAFIVVDNLCPTSSPLPHPPMVPGLDLSPTWLGRGGSRDEVMLLFFLWPPMFFCAPPPQPLFFNAKKKKEIPPQKRFTTPPFSIF
eukprot:Hpha_TRINITY_DN15693_c1_g2::TRINITY_DN15693_c1_g2_i2::g.99332::m.99332